MNFECFWANLCGVQLYFLALIQTTSFLLPNEFEEEIQKQLHFQQKSLMKEPQFDDRRRIRKTRVCVLGENVIWVKNEKNYGLCFGVKWKN